MARKKNPVNLSRFTLAYVTGRRSDLVEDAGERNARRDTYERYVNLDFFSDDPAEGEIRIALPVAWDTVIKLKALTFGRRWMVTVPSSGGPDTAETERAQKLERFLYGVTDRLGLYRHAGFAEQDALTMERGWVKAVYDAQAAEDEFPVKVTTPDPRTVYPVWDAGRERPTELVHTWTRTRRAVQDEWGVTLKQPLAVEDEDAWLDEEVDYSELWKAEVVLDAPEDKEGDGPDEGLDAKLNTVEGLQNSELRMQNSESSMQTDGQPSLGEALAAQGLYEPNVAGTRKALDKGQGGGKKREKVRVRKIVHCAWVGEGEEEDENTQWVKKPVVMVGYKHIPFFGWAGIGTPPSNTAYDGQSVLFPLSAGDSSDKMKAMGVLQAMNMMASIMLDETVRRAHAPLQTTKKDGVIDLSPDAVNKLGAGESIGFIAQPPQTNDIPKSMNVLREQVNAVATPEVLNGQVFNLSGQAISGLANAFQMVIADRQTEREAALRQVYGHILTLAREYADPVDGWEAYGDGKWGKFVTEKILPEDVGASTRVVVKLSSNMPKDEAALASLFVSLWKANAISWETLLDQIQKMFGLAADSPTDEIIRVLRDKLLMSEDTLKTLGQPLADEYARLIRNSAGLPETAQAPSPAAAPPAAPPPAPASSDGRGEMGMPPGSVTPDMVAAAGNLQGAMNMPGLMRG